VAGHAVVRDGALTASGVDDVVDRHRQVAARIQMVAQ
jgi:hypothetical protein